MDCPLQRQRPPLLGLTCWGSTSEAHRRQPHNARRLERVGPLRQLTRVCALVSSRFTVHDLSTSSASTTCSLRVASAAAGRPGGLTARARSSEAPSPARTQAAIGDGGHPQQAQLGKPARRLLHEGWTLVAEAEDPAPGLLQRPTARPPPDAARREFRWTPPTWARAQGGDATPPQGGARPGAIPGDGTQRAASAAAAGATAAGAASARPTAAVVLDSCNA